MEEKREGGFEELLARLGRIDTHTVFGEPYTHDGLAVIPVATIGYGGGGGGGAERAPQAEETEQAGEGQGLGFAVRARPLGVIEVKNDSVRWVPIVDLGRMAVVWSIAMGLLLIMVLRKMMSD